MTAPRKPSGATRGLGNRVDLSHKVDTVETPPTAPAAPAPPPAPAKRDRPVRRPMHVSPELYERAQRTVVHLAAPPELLTMWSLAERALTAELERLERKHNGGQPYPPVPQGPRAGRPPGRKTRKRGDAG